MNGNYDRRQKRRAMAQCAQICLNAENVLRDRQNKGSRCFLAPLPPPPTEILMECSTVSRRRPSPGTCRFSPAEINPVRETDLPNHQGRRSQRSGGLTKSYLYM